MSGAAAVAKASQKLGAVDGEAKTTASCMSARTPPLTRVCPRACAPWCAPSPRAFTRYRPTSTAVVQSRNALFLASGHTRRNRPSGAALRPK